MSPGWLGLDWRLLLQLLLAVGALGLAFVRFARSQHAPRTMAPGRLESGFWGLAAALCVLTWWGVLLAEAGLFEGDALTLPPLIVGLATVVILRRSGRSPARRPSKTAPVVA
ncbi:MAG: hypothetical protein ACOC5E_03335, partial [Acidobacteriota bacterium]